MPKNLQTQLLIPRARRPGRRWGEGLPSIIEFLSARQRTIEDDMNTGPAELRALSGERVKLLRLPRQ